MGVTTWSLMALGALLLVVFTTWDRARDGSADDPGDGRGRLRALGALAVWFGLVTGTLYALAVAGIRLSGDRLMFHHREVLWMAPVAHVAVNLVAAVVIAPLALLAGRTRFLSVAIGGFMVVSVVSLLLPADQLARWAVLILALGVAVQLTRVGRRPGRRAWRFAIAVAAVVVVVSAGAGLRRSLVERRGMAAVAERADTPNVLLIVLDTVRSESLSLYGYARRTTPALERLASDSTVFDMALASTSWTLPSHATLFTGEIGTASGGDWLHPVRLPDVNLPSFFRDHGYATGGFVSNLVYTSWESGLTGGILHHEDYRRTLFQVLQHSPFARLRLPDSVFDARSPGSLARGLMEFRLQVRANPADEYKPAPLVTDGFLDWQQSLGDRPFFAFLNYFDAHPPFRAPESYMARFRTDEGGLIDRYDAAIAFLDDELERLVGTLEARGVLDDTVVVVTSDHGELFGEHGLKGHANSLYMPLLRVPLLVRYPARVPGGVRVSRPVSLIDLPATLLDLSGQDPAGLPGASLADPSSEASDEGTQRPVFSELIPGLRVPGQRNTRTWLQSVVLGRLHFIRDGEGKEELFDVAADPGELTNLVADPAYAAEADTLRKLLTNLEIPGFR